MKEGEVVLAALPQANGFSKLRPVLLLREFPRPYSDFLVCSISSRMFQLIENFDEPLLRSDDDFEDSGILKESVIRLSFLAWFRIDNWPAKLAKYQTIGIKKHCRDYAII